MTKLQKDEYYRMIRHATFKWVEMFVKKQGVFPTTKHWNKERFGVPYSLQKTYNAFGGGMIEIKHYCYQRGITTDRFSSRGWTLQALREHLPPKLHTALAGKPHLSWNDVERLVYALGISVAPLRAKVADMLAG